MADGPLEDEREEELASLSAIFPELQLDPSHPFSAALSIPITLAEPVTVRFCISDDGTPPTKDTSGQDNHDSTPASQTASGQERVHQLKHLPPLSLEVSLPDGYPAVRPPVVKLSTTYNWLPQSVLSELETRAEQLWEEYGHCQIIYTYIDFLQQGGDTGFGLLGRVYSPPNPNSELEIALVAFNRRAHQEIFDRGSYDCGICLEPKKGTACHQMLRCGHVFCFDCLQDFYNNAIREGDVAAIKCLDVSCGKKNQSTSGRIKKSTRTLGPGELLMIGIGIPETQRYVELKRKKKLEADKTTIYCPRQWCQGPARSKKHPKVSDLYQLESYESDSENESNDMPEPGDDKALDPGHDRLRICEDCTYAFCRVCLAGWHGDFVRCWPRSAAELSDEEKQSYDWIRLHTSPCPTCSTPCQKTHGCNHMQCYQCRTHFCYLCSAWLDPSNPYQHFNKKELGCYERLWELEEGDPGDGNVRFEGPRGWEAALAAAAEADAAEQRQVDAARNPHLVDAPAELDAVVARMAAVQLAPLNDDAAAAIADLLPVPQQPLARAQDRLRGNEIGRRILRNEPRLGLQRFLEMAEEDREDEWDSDELDEDGDDAEWEIPFRD